MCDNKNELHTGEYNKSANNISTRLDLDISETTDSYPEFDFLDLLRNLQVKEKKLKLKGNSEDTTNKSNLFCEEDSDVESLAKFYEEKYGTCNDYAELGEGYDEEDSFIDNSDAVNDLVPSGIQTEFGGFYINRGKLNFVKEDNSSSSTSEDVDKFLAHNRLNTRKIISDDENEEKEIIRSQSNNHGSSNVLGSNNSTIYNNPSNNNLNNSSHINNNYCNNNNNNHSSNGSGHNNGSLHNNVFKSRKKSGEYQNKNKKIRKTATPKIPDHLLHKKPFLGSHEYRKNINEFKKNRLKVVDSDKKSVTNSTTVNNNNNINNNNNNNNNSDNIGNNHNKLSSVNNSINNNCSEDTEKEGSVVKKKSATVKELLKERDGASEVIEAVATGTNVGAKQYSSSSDSSDSSSSESDSDSSEDTVNEKEKTSIRTIEEIPPGKSSVINGFTPKDYTAKSFAHLSGGLKELIAKIVEISKEEKNKFFNSKLNTLLLSIDERLRELPMVERNPVLEYVAEILQMKKDNVTKRTKKLLVLQEEAKMSSPLRKLKDTVAAMMPLLESTYFNEYTKAAATRSIDSSSLPLRKFPWNDELRHHLREVIQYRKNCYYIIRPRKESLMDYVRNFMETKVKSFWPKEWMTVDILLEEAQVTCSRYVEDKSKTVTKILGTQNQTHSQKKVGSNMILTSAGSRKHSTSGSSATNRKSAHKGPSNHAEVKSILIPRKAPQTSLGSGSTSSSKSNASSAPHTQNTVQGSRLQVSLNRLNVQEYLDRISGSQTSISRNPLMSQQISPNKTQQSVSPNRLVKTSPNPVLNSNAIHPNGSKNTSPNSTSKSLSTMRNTKNAQSVLKTIEIHSNPISGSKTSPNSVTISPVNDSVFKDLTPSAEVLNLTKNSSVFFSKVKDYGESKQNGRSSSPSIGIPLPSGITISPTNASPSTFLVKPQKATDKNSESSKINVSITKQESPTSLTKEKRESVLNINVKREGPLQNIPDCISVTSKMVTNERHKYEHVRKRALQEYHHQQQQHSPDKTKPEEKKMKKEENQSVDSEMKEEKFDDMNFSKIFDSVIAKTSETVRQSESTASHGKPGDRHGSESSSGLGLVPVKNSSVVGSQFRNNASKVRDIRSIKEKTYYANDGEGNSSTDKKKYENHDERSDNIREQRVQMEMDRVMQNLVELSREKNPEYDYEYDHHSVVSGYSTSSSGLNPPSFQEALHKMFK